MISQRQLFLLHNAQTSKEPLMLEIERADGVYIYDVHGKKYLDFISGISVSSIGHRHPNVLKAIQLQMDKYLHTMVYGEYVLSPQVLLANKLHQLLTSSWNNEVLSSYFVNSGAEAIDGAMKLAKRVNGRRNFIAFKNGYHGSTQAALSLMSDDYFKSAFEPLLPNVSFLDFGNYEQLSQINDTVSAVFIEMIQSESGYTVVSKEWLQALYNQCNQHQVLLVIDEVQTGFGRTGKMFAFETMGIVPDILVLAKGMGGGMPIGAFIAPKKYMDLLSHNPVLGHITTFGGHAICCASSLATINVLENTNWIQLVSKKEELIRSQFNHLGSQRISGKGLMLSLAFEDFERNKKVIDRCIEKGLITDWFLHAPNKLRITPPLCIQNEELIWACQVIKESMKELNIE